MIKRRIPALLLALSPLWVSASVYAEEVTQADPVAAIDEKLSNKQNEINAILTDYEVESGKLQQLKNEQSRLEEAKIEARVKRLAAELRESSVLETTFKTTCSTTMTLGECANQGQYLTKQKAVKTFRENLINDVTESAIAKQNLKGVEFNIHVQESQMIRSGFEGNNEYFTQMQAQLQAKPEAVAACKLLNVETRYCLKGESEQAAPKKQDKQWANVTVRSDQYNDSVTINGVNYGSTPVELVLPAGKHQVTVSKEGYETYNRVITVNGNDTVWVKLRPNKDS
ncbi:TPA: PEGA domain-containing protein [Vibrio cholerae]|nr:PEGA domain-containing protein [Vibrio cholerae]